MITQLRLAVAGALLALPLLAHATDAAQAAPPTGAPAASAPTSAEQDTTAPAAAPQPAAAQPSAATPTAPAHGKVPAPPAGKGQVVFFREKKFAGSMISFMVREGTKEEGKLGSGDYFVAVLDPGAHDFTVHSENQDTLHMEIEAGETYYVQGSISMGFMAGHTHITPSDEASFEKDFDSLKLSN